MICDKLSMFDPMSLLWPSSSSQFGLFFACLASSLYFFEFGRMKMGTESAFVCALLKWRINKNGIGYRYIKYLRLLPWNILHNFIVFCFWEKMRACVYRESKADDVPHTTVHTIHERWTVWSSRHCFRLHFFGSLSFLRFDKKWNVSISDASMRCISTGESHCIISKLDTVCVEREIKMYALIYFRCIAVDWRHLGILLEHFITKRPLVVNESHLFSVCCRVLIPKRSRFFCRHRIWI